MFGVRTLQIAIPLLLLAGCHADPFDEDGDGWTADVDCDDSDPSVHPGADERCNQIDDDCDGEIDGPSSVDAVFGHVDVDADGFGAGDAVLRCPGDGPVTVVGGDCDDADPLVHPGADELCDDVDHDCDGDAHDGAVDARQWYRDADGDTFAGTPAGFGCGGDPALSDIPEDCDDADPQIRPGAFERCDHVDQDCDGSLGFDVVVGVHAGGVAAAVDLARDGDEVCIPEGTYAANLTLGARDLTLVGAGRGRTVLDGGGGRMFDLNGTRFGLRDLSLQDVAANVGGFVRAVSGEVVLERVAARGATAAGGAQITGVGLDLRDTDTRLEDVSLIEFELESSSHADGAVVNTTGGTLAIDGLAIRQVVVRSPWVSGTLKADGTHITGSDLSLHAIEVYDAGRGAGLAVHGSVVQLERVELSNFEFESYMGGVLFARSSEIELSELDIVQVTGGRTPIGYVDNYDGGFLHLWRVRVDEVAGLGVNPLMWVKGDFVLENFVFARPRLIGSGTPVAVYWGGTSGHTATVRQGFYNVSGGDPMAFLYASGGLAEVSNVAFGPGVAEPLMAYGAEARVHVHDVSTTWGDRPAGSAYDGVTLHERIHQLESPGFTSVSGPVLDWDLTLTSRSRLRDLGDPEVMDVDGTRSDIGPYGGPRGGAW